MRRLGALTLGVFVIFAAALLVMSAGGNLRTGNNSNSVQSEPVASVDESSADLPEQLAYPRERNASTGPALAQRKESIPEATPPETALADPLPPALALAAPGASGLFLVKPQFEAGREAIGKGGLLKDPNVGPEIARDIAMWLDTVPGWRVLGLHSSPIEGGDGNREFLLGAIKDHP